MVEPPRPARVVSVVPLDHLHVRLDFDDGVERTLDLTALLQGDQFKQIRLSDKYFRTVHVEHGSLVWDNGMMLDADLLRYGPPKTAAVPAKGKAEAKSGKAKAAAKAKVKAKPVAKPVAKKVGKVSKAIKPAAKKAKPTKPAAKPKAAKPAKKAAKKKK